MHPSSADFFLVLKRVWSNQSEISGARSEHSQIVPCSPGALHLIWGRAAGSWWAPARTKLPLSFVPGSLTAQHPQLGQLDMKLTSPAPQPPHRHGSRCRLTRAQGTEPTSDRKLAALVRGFRPPLPRPGAAPSLLGFAWAAPRQSPPQHGRAASRACRHCLGPWLTGAGIILDEAALNL